MLPILLDLKFIKIYTFGVFLVLALFWGAFLLWKNIRLTSYKEEDVFDSLFMSLGFGLLVGRIVHVILNFDKFGFDILKFLLINGYPGLSLYGCVAGFFAGLALYTVSRRMKFLEVVDYFISPLLFSIALGKLGGFFSGVEVGSKTKYPLAIKYAGLDGARNLTSLYESILFFLAAYIAYRLLFAIRRQIYTRGFNFYFFWWALSFIYFFFDPLKSTHTAFAHYKSVNSFFSLTLLLTFTFYFLYYFRGLLLGKSEVVRSSLISYGQKIRSSASGKIKRGEGENPQSN